MIAGFGAYAHLRYIVELAAVIGLVGIGQTIAVIGGGIDLSVSAVITVTAIILPLVSFDVDATGLGAIALALIVAAGIGAVNGLGIGYLGPAAADHDPRHGDDPARAAHPHCRRQRHLGHQPFARLARLDACPDHLGQHPPVGDRGRGLPVLAAWDAQRLAHLRHRRQSGRQPAVGRADPPADARTYVISGFCAGLAGLLLLSMNGQGYVGIGDPYLLSSIAAVVLGGTSILGGQGSYLGTIAGAVLLVTMTALITVVNASEGWRSVILGCLILAMLPLSGRDQSR